VGAGATGWGGSFSLALFGVGHLVGLATGLAMLVGLLIAWGVAVPIFTTIYPAPDLSLADHATDMWQHKVRFIGAGAIGLAAIWTLGGLAKPVLQGLVIALTGKSGKGAATGDERDLDLSPAWVIGLSSLCLAVSAYLVWKFATDANLPPLGLTIAAVAVILVLGFVIAAICGYMAGLIGSSNSPLSGVGILAVVTSALIFVAVSSPTLQQQPALVAFTLFVTAIIFASATIANGNLQDLKTGQLVGATPWRQQVALVLGVFAGAIVIPPVMDLLAHAYGFAGAPHTATITAHPLPAPQAGLISALALGVIQHKLDWGLIGIGALIGAVIIAADEGLKSFKLMTLPPLAVGIGIYLPLDTNMPIVLGAIVGWWFERYASRSKHAARLKRLGVLIASGLIVGESLFGVALAGMIWGFHKDAPLALVSADFSWAIPIGLVSFGALVVFLYSWAIGRGKKA
jgi:putative OPT family oligopeptide transporter